MKTVLAPLAAILVALFIYPDSVGAFTEGQGRASLKLARRQADMYDAKIKSDWQKIYSLFTPDLRKKIPLSRFIANPHNMDEKAMNISGAKTSSPKNKTYLPLHLGYRFKDFYISKDGKKAKVVSRVPMPNFTLQFKNVLYFMDDEYWIKIDGKWYSQLDMKIIAHLSGATTEMKNRVSFENVIHIKADELADWFAEKAEKLPPGAQRNAFIQNALLADFFRAIEVFDKKKINAGNLPDEYIFRQILGHPTSVFYYPILIKAARWFAKSGNNKLSHEYYMKAHEKDGTMGDALVGLAVTAIKLGSFEEGVKYYIEYLKVISMLPETQPKTLASYINDGCSICPEISLDTKIAFARQLVGAQRWEQAFAVYKNILESRPQWQGIWKKLKSGALVKSAALGELIERELRNLTFFEMRKMLQTAGYRLLRSSDFSQENESEKNPPLEKGRWRTATEGLGKARKTTPWSGAATSRSELQVRLESIPKIYQRRYNPNYVSNPLPARALIQLADKKFSHSSYYSAGYVAVIIEDGKPARGGFYPDNIGKHAGNSKLMGEIKKLASGAKVFLARISIKPAWLDSEWLETLSSIGMQAGELQKEITAHLIYGVRQYPAGSARVWNGFYAIRKLLFSSGKVEAKNSSVPGLVISDGGIRLLER